MRRILSLALCLFISGMLSAQEYTLKLNMSPGQHFSFSTLTDMNMTMTITGQDMDIKTKMTFVYNEEVKSVSPEGNLVLEFAFSRIMMDMSGSGNSVTYDTEKKSDKKDGGPLDLSKVCDPLIGKKFSATMTSSGKVTAIKGLKELNDSIAQNLDPSNAQMLKGLIDEAKMTKSLESSYGYLPAGKVKVGDKWTQNTKLDMNLPISVDVTYTLKEVKGTTAKLEYSSEINSKDDNYENGGIKMKIDIKGSMTGKCDMDIKSGLFSTTKATFLMKGTMEAMGTEIPVSADGTQESKLLSVKQ